MDYRPLSGFARALKNNPNALFLHQPRERQWRSYSFAEVNETARRFSSSLYQLGLKKGDKVSILSKNCAEWVIADLGIMMAGMISVPIYFSAGADTIEYVLRHSEAKAIILGKLDDTSVVDSSIPNHIRTIALPYNSSPKAQYQWDDLISKHDPLTAVFEPSDDDIMSIIYTSGSTGKPKGVLISYANTQGIGEAASGLNVEPLTQEDRIVSYLPLAHIAERGLVELPALSTGTQIFFIESLNTFRDDICYAKPTVFFAVPRIWLKIQLQILERIPPRIFDRLITLPIIGKLLTKKLKRTLGFEKTKLFISGSAPISPEVLRWFHRLSINISEGWAMSETACVGTINAPFRLDDVGTIGRAMPGMELKLSDDGEILVKGRFITPGYYKQDEETATAIKDGWLHTGDLGKINPNGSLSIIGRIKEQFKTSKGKYVSPVIIESRLSAHPMIEQVCVAGRGLPQPIAFVVLAEGATPDQRRLERLLKRVNDESESHERLDAIYVCSSPWLIENQLLTPTMKIKRDAIEQKYQSILDDFSRETMSKGIHFE